MWLGVVLGSMILEPSTLGTVVGAIRPLLIVGVGVAIRGAAGLSRTVCFPSVPGELQNHVKSRMRILSFKHKSVLADAGTSLNKKKENERIS